MTSAWGFTVVACLALFYSVVLYLWRVDKIRKRRAVRYHDKYGPTLLCLGLLAATIVTFFFRIRENGWFEQPGTTNSTRMEL
jgi:hypothetical protein